MKKEKVMMTVAQRAEFEEMYKAVSDLFMDREKGYAWMTTENLNLGGSSPLELILKNKGDKVQEFIKDAGGAFR